MCIRIFEQDPYVFEFEAVVTSVNDDWISIDATAFYPGGGGQVNDLGRICGLDVTDVKINTNQVIFCRVRLIKGVFVGICKGFDLKSEYISIILISSTF